MVTPIKNETPQVLTYIQHLQFLNLEAPIFSYNFYLLEIFLHLFLKILCAVTLKLQCYLTKQEHDIIIPLKVTQLNMYIIERKNLFENRRYT
jgi:hypothetical protein